MPHRPTHAVLQVNHNDSFWNVMYNNHFKLNWAWWCCCHTDMLYSYFNKDQTDSITWFCLVPGIFLTFILYFLLQLYFYSNTEWSWKDDILAFVKENTWNISINVAESKRPWCSSCCSCCSISFEHIEWTNRWIYFLCSGILRCLANFHHLTTGLPRLIDDGQASQTALLEKTTL